MPKKRVYVESSVISYLTARPARVLAKLVKQQQTADWWELRDRWELYVSPVVILEIQDGNPEAANRRLDAVAGLPQLPYPVAARDLAGRLVAAGVVPQKAATDATHIAIAAVNRMDYLVTWNQAHIVNMGILEKVYLSIREAGYAPPMLVRPDYFLEVGDDV